MAGNRLGASSLQELESASIVADPAAVIQHRSLLSQRECSGPILGKSNAFKDDLQWAWASRPQLSGKKEDEWTQGGDRRWSSWTSDHWGDFAREPQEVDTRKQNIQNRISSREMEDHIWVQTKDQQHHRRWASGRISGERIVDLSWITFILGSAGWW